MPKTRLGQVLVERGILTEEDLNRAVAVQQESKQMRLGEILLESGSASKQEIAAAIAQVQGVEAAASLPAAIAPKALALLPRSVALRCCALPLELKDNLLIVAMAEPQNLILLADLAFSSGKPIMPRFSFRADILEGIKKFYPGDGKSIAAAEVRGGEAENFGINLTSEVNPEDLQFISACTRDETREAMKELQVGTRQVTYAVRLVGTVLAVAAQKGASDVHVEPRIDSSLVRFRIDGVLREFTTIPAEHHASVISRIKILADMDIADRRVPQDGRFLMVYRGRRLDLRVSSLPTHFGEKIVIRILDPRSTLTTFRQLGFSERQSAEVNRLLAMPQGMFIVTGPTGSGKSTTLYAALNCIHSPIRNIITVEDPIEYMLDGVNQVQVNPRAGLTFASCLPSILRQDPDVIMVGEIRDAETAEIALKASQTGHLVFSTLHTNDSVAAITRLQDLGIPSYLIGSVNGVLGQRLLRKLCSCRNETEADSDYLQRMAAMGEHGSISRMFQPVGCPVCDHSGYKGRVGIYELLLIEGVVRDAICSEARPEEIRDLARSAGFVTMREDAVEKVKQGLTTPDEVMRVVPIEAAADLRCPRCAREISPSFRFCPHCGSARLDPPAKQRGALTAPELAPHLVVAH